MPISISTRAFQLSHQKNYRIWKNKTSRTQNKSIFYLTHPRSQSFFSESINKSRFYMLSLRVSFSVECHRLTQNLSTKKLGIIDFACEYLVQYLSAIIQNKILVILTYSPTKITKNYNSIYRLHIIQYIPKSNT